MADQPNTNDAAADPAVTDAANPPAAATPDALAAALDAAAADTRAAAADVAELSAALAAEGGAAPGPDAVADAPAPDPRLTNAPTEYAAPDLREQAGGRELASIDLLDDVELDVKVELGRADMYIEDVLKLGVGSVVELNKLAGDPVDIYVNERLIARGEVLVLNDSFCVRVNEIVSPVPELAGNP